MEILIQYAMSWVGRPYIWGGDDFTGWDCSGFVQEILASSGEDPPGDQTAQGLFNHFTKNGRWGLWTPGALVFYGKGFMHISHVGFMVDNFRMIEAGGGGPKTKTAKDAAKHNAFVRIRPVMGRKDFQAVIRPHYAKIGSL